MFFVLSGEFLNNQYLKAWLRQKLSYRFFVSFLGLFLEDSVDGSSSCKILQLTTELLKDLLELLIEALGSIFSTMLVHSSSS